MTQKNTFHHSQDQSLEFEKTDEISSFDSTQRELQVLAREEKKYNGVLLGEAHEVGCTLKRSFVKI